jgi:hypothetical protein
MKTKEIKINCPEGFEIDRENSTFECIKFKPIEKELPKTWKEFCKTHPRKAGEAYIKQDSACNVVNTTVGCTRSTVEDRNLLPSKELAEAMLALCQLIQLRDCYNDGWVPDWTNGGELKYVIFTYEGAIILDRVWTANRILTFKTVELRDQFLENFQDLIETAKPLL